MMQILGVVLIVLSVLGMIKLERIRFDRWIKNIAEDKRIIGELARIQLEELNAEDQGYTFEAPYDNRDN